MSDCVIEAEEIRGSEGVLDVPMPRTSACCGGPSANVGVVASAAQIAEGDMAVELEACASGAVAVDAGVMEQISEQIASVTQTSDPAIVSKVRRRPNSHQRKRSKMAEARK